MIGRRSFLRGGAAAFFLPAAPRVLRALTIQPVRGASQTFSASQNGADVLRSNSGALMTDTLPGPARGLLPQGTDIHFENVDTNGALYVAQVANGATLDGQPKVLPNGQPGGYTVLGAGQSSSIVADGSGNHYSLTKPGRFKLAGPWRFNYATNGSVANLGLSSSSPALSAQQLYAWLQANGDLAGQSVKLQAASGLYGTQEFFNGPLFGLALPTDILVLGNPNDLSAYAYDTSVSGGCCFAGICGAKLSISGFCCLKSAQANIAFDSPGTDVFITGTMAFGTPQDWHISATGLARITRNASYSIAGIAPGSPNAHGHINADYGGIVRTNVPITVTIGAPMTFTTAFATARGMAVVEEGGVTYQNAALVSGLACHAAQNGTVITGSGGNPHYFPGDGLSIDATSSYS
jgi:hypothetical protein